MSFLGGIYTALAAVIAFAVTALSGIKLVPFLHKLKFGQNIREEGPTWHRSKQGTPTMGGIMFAAGSLIALIISYSLYCASVGGETMLSVVRTAAGMLMASAMGLIGFMDDFISIKKKRNLGLNELQKLRLQFAVVICYLITIRLAGGSDSMVIPFVGTVRWGIFYYIISAVFIVGMVNAVNFTDGIDGLNSSVTFVVCLCFMVISFILKNAGMAVLAAATAGGCLGFLIWNFNPAKVFMGDTGSLFLGGMVCALAYGINAPILLIPMGIIYIAEIVSVVMQVTYYKLTHGKRIFKMTPIHHHFELCGWNEIKICFVFSAVSLAAGLVCILLAAFGM